MIQKEVLLNVDLLICRSARRKIDLVTVSVLLDAGAGPDWKYVGENEEIHTRSEGIVRSPSNVFLSITLVQALQSPRLICLNPEPSLRTRLCPIVSIRSASRR
jgi:hypothetical protein